MKIAVIAPTPYFSDRGCHVRILEEARALQQEGHEVRIFTYHLGRDMAGIPVERIPRIPWYRKLSAGPSWHKPYLDILLFLRALAGARRFRPDLIHAHLHEGAFIGIFLKKILHIPLLFDCQGSLTGELVEHRFITQNSVLYRLFTRLESWITHSADQIVTSSTPTSEALRRDFGLLARVTPLVDAVNIEDFQPGEGDRELRESLGIPKGKKVAVYLGAMSEQQGIDLLLKVIQNVTRERGDIHFLLMGYPEEGYRRRAFEMGLDGSVIFTGKIDYARAADYLRLGDVAISPKLSRTEANGKLFNYMACGLPCIVFDTPVNREILGEAGIYAAYADEKDFAAALVRALDEPSRRHEYSSAVRMKAMNEHSWTARGRQLAQLCESLCHLSPRSKNER